MPPPVHLTLSDALVDSWNLGVMVSVNPGLLRPEKTALMPGVDGGLSSALEPGVIDAVMLTLNRPQVRGLDRTSNRGQNRPVRPALTPDVATDDIDRSADSRCSRTDGVRVPGQGWGDGIAPARR